MAIQLDRIGDKIEFYEAFDLPTLEALINDKIEQNKALLLRVHSVQHSVHIHPKTERPVYTAVVHYKEP
ncbi:YrzA family protein [Halalkalibacter oceani]|uniref:YrzA family protein n=1 Tax=Halalkalibacter oceani TaxID=1653776 RepID=UPI00339A8B54